MRGFTVRRRRVAATVAATFLAVAPIGVMASPANAATSSFSSSGVETYEFEAAQGWGYRSFPFDADGLLAFQRDMATDGQDGPSDLLRYDTQTHERLANITLPEGVGFEDLSPALSMTQDIGAAITRDDEGEIGVARFATTGEVLSYVVTPDFAGGAGGLNFSTVVVNGDASIIYIGNVHIEPPILVAINAVTGEEIAQIPIGFDGLNLGSPVHDLVITSDGSTLIAAVGPIEPDGLIGLVTVDTATNQPLALFGVGDPEQAAGQTSGIELSADEKSVFLSDYAGFVRQVDIATGAELSAVELPESAYVLAVDERHDRVFYPSPDTSTVVSAQLSTGEYVADSEVSSEIQVKLGHSRVTGDLVVVDSDDLQKAHHLVAPRVGDPEDVTVTSLGETAIFTSAVVGIENGSETGLQWQSSIDGITWVDVAGEHNMTLTVPVTEKTLANQYRLHYANDFWGRDDATTAARILAPPPVITTDSLPAGEMGSEYGPVSMTADFLPGLTEHVWSASGLPRGLRIDPNTGVISGVIEESGTFTVTVTVTDAAGTSTRELSIVVAADPVEPTPTPDPEPGTGGESPSTGAGPHSPEKLAVTGIDSRALLMRIGVALLALGFGSALIRRHRRFMR